MNYFHETLDETSAEALRLQLAEFNIRDDSEFTDDIVERLPGYNTTIKAVSLTRHILQTKAIALIEGFGSLAAARLQVKTSCFTCEALRYEAGVGLSIHNDFEDGITNYPGGRVIVQLSNPEVRGGELEIYRQLLDGTFEPILTCEMSRSHVVGFVVSEDSFHAVQPIERGRRTSIVLNLWLQGATLPVALTNRIWRIPTVAKAQHQLNPSDQGSIQIDSSSEY